MRDIKQTLFSPILLGLLILLTGCAEKAMPEKTTTNDNPALTETPREDTSATKVVEPMPPEVKQPFRIVPLEPIETIRARAENASPPTEEGKFRDADLVEITDLEPTIKLDIRYASENNFMGSQMYQQARAFLQLPAAEALVAAHRELESHGFGILVYDGYRPWTITKMFWDATPKHQRDFVANPADGSRHNRGCAVDIGLYDLRTGAPVEMPSDYDEFTERAYVSYANASATAKNNRSLLIRVMESHGFSVYSKEWWHFDYVDWREYPIINIPFEDL